NHQEVDADLKPAVGSHVSRPSLSIRSRPSESLRLKERVTEVHQKPYRHQQTHDVVNRHGSLPAISAGHPACECGQAAHLESEPVASGHVENCHDEKDQRPRNEDDVHYQLPVLLPTHHTRPTSAVF